MEQSENKNEQADSSQSFIVSEFLNIIIKMTFIKTGEFRMFCMSMNSTICGIKYPGVNQLKS